MLEDNKGYHPQWSTEVYYKLSEFLDQFSLPQIVKVVKEYSTKITTKKPSAQMIFLYFITLKKY